MWQDFDVICKISPFMYPYT